jgi:hypothetical protein
VAERIDIVPQITALAPDSWRYKEVPTHILAAQSERITALNVAIWETPEAYLDAVSFLGNITLPQDEALPATYTQAPIETGARLRAFLENNDDLRAGFDEGSEAAIYGDEEVRSRISFHRKKLTVRHRSVGRDQTATEDHPEAATYLDQLSLYKLYLYIGRVRTYKAEDGKDGSQSAA